METLRPVIKQCGVRVVLLRFGAYVVTSLIPVEYVCIGTEFRVRKKDPLNFENAVAEGHEGRKEHSGDIWGGVV